MRNSEIIVKNNIIEKTTFIRHNYIAENPSDCVIECIGIAFDLGNVCKMSFAGAGFEVDLAKQLN